MTSPPIDDSTRLSATRTCLSYDRTLMAWIRTSTSLIAFGFTIYQLFRYIATQTREPLVSPQVVGTMMVLVGLTTLILAAIQHRRDVNGLRARFGDLPRSSTPEILAALIAAWGLVALVGVVVRF
jgi:putative membrane protein